MVCALDFQIKLIFVVTNRYNPAISIIKLVLVGMEIDVQKSILGPSDREP